MEPPVANRAPVRGGGRSNAVLAVLAELDYVSSSSAEPSLEMTM